MSSAVKYSRRQVTNGLMKLIESGASTKRIAEILATYLVKTKQTRDTELYLRDFELAMAKTFDMTTIHTYSVRKLSQATKKRIKQLVAAFSGTSKFEIIEEINPELIGGVVVRTADAEMDGSIRAKIQNLRSI